MRNERRIACGALLLGSILVGVTVAQAQPDKPGAGNKGEQGKPDKAPPPKVDANKPGKADDPHGKADGPHGKADDPHGKADDPHGKPPKGDGDPAADKRPARGAWRELMAELKAGKLKKKDIKERLGKLRENTDARRAEHQAEVKARWGNALAQPAARQELENHARRMARLNRAAFLAETEITKDKDKLIERIQKLTAQEQSRHERAMERFKSLPPLASAAPPPVAPPAAASAQAGEK